MIAACPKCATRYRVDRERLSGEGLRLRCNRCQTVFRVRPPAPREAEAAPEPREGDLPQSPASSAAAEPERDRRRLILVANPEPATCKRVAAALERWGLEPVVAHDGVEAILTIQRMLPRAVVLDAALPRMFGFQVCELVKRNESLRSTWVVLIGAIHNPERYRRPPNDLYGADAYLEHQELPDGLLPLLRRFGLPVREAAGEPDAASSPRQTRGAAPAPPAREPAPSAPLPPRRPAAPAASTPAAPSPAAGAPGLDEPRARAERLARIIVSDIVLYNEEKFAAAVQTGDVVGALAVELEEARNLFRERIDARVREERDYLAEELVRVARARGMS